MSIINRLIHSVSWFGVIAAGVATLSLSGCYSPGKKYRAPDITQGAPKSSYMTDDGNKIDLGKIESDYNKAKTDQAARDRIINQFMFVSDRACVAHLSAVSANNATANFTLGSITSLTAGLAAFVGSGATPQALSASAAFASGSRSLMNETFYNQQVGPVITKLIRENREKFGNAIRTEMAKPAAEYTIDQALYEVGRYHESCSFYVGIELIDRAVQTQRKTKPELDSEIAMLTTRITELLAELTSLKAASPLSADLITKKEEVIKALEDSRRTLMNERISALN